MTSAPAAGGRRGPLPGWLARRGPAALWMGHHGTPFTWAGIALLTAYTLSPTRPLALSIVTAVAVAGWLAAAAASLYHQRRLCARCMAAMPLDPQAAVAQWRPVLWWWHRHPVNLALVAAALGWVCYNLQAGVPAGGARAALAASWILVAALGWIGRRHGALQPWCPWCRDDEGDGDPAPEPDPTTPAARPR